MVKDCYIWLFKLVGFSNEGNGVSSLQEVKITTAKHFWISQVAHIFPAKLGLNSHLGRVKETKNRFLPPKQHSTRLIWKKTCPPQKKPTQKMALWAEAKVPPEKHTLCSDFIYLSHTLSKILCLCRCWFMLSFQNVCCKCMSTYYDDVYFILALIGCDGLNQLIIAAPSYRHP